MSFFPSGQPVAAVAGSLILASLIVSFTDRFALAQAARGKVETRRAAFGLLSDAAARLVLIVLVFAFFFGISWRPLYALAGTVSFFVIFTGISRAKFEFIREPLIFADIALVLLVFRHKELFSATWLNLVFFAGATTYIFGASALFFYFEPSILPAGAGVAPVLFVLALAILPWLALALRPVRLAAARTAARILGADQIDVLTMRLGTFPAVIYGFLAWLGERRKLQPPAQAVPRTRDAKAPPLVLVWQSESFMDMRHFDVPMVLPNLDRLRARAVEWGRMASVFEGGYTLRTEFAVLSGVPTEELGPDAAYPYLRADHFAETAWPNRFRRAGWSTRFIHPYDRRFFSRDQAMPLLGFETMTMLDDFDHDPARDGPYVSDMTLTHRVLDAARQPDGRAGQFIFAASMENHAPWKPGRLDGRTTPLDIYAGLLERSDAALGFLVDQLDGMKRPVWLVFYGDHAPILKSFADPFPDSRTEYVIVPLAQATDGTETGAPPHEKAPWELIAAAVSHMDAAGDAARPR